MDGFCWEDQKWSLEGAKCKNCTCCQPNHVKHEPPNTFCYQELKLSVAQSVKLSMNCVEHDTKCQVEHESAESTKLIFSQEWLYLCCLMIVWCFNIWLECLYECLVDVWLLSFTPHIYGSMLVNVDCLIVQTWSI